MNWHRARAEDDVVPIAPLEQGAMHHNVVEARFVRDYVVWVRFQDGTSGEVNLQDELHGRLFGPLRDPVRFREFRVDSDSE
jgi:hypothetical protein